MFPIGNKLRRVGRVVVARGYPRQLRRAASAGADTRRDALNAFLKIHKTSSISCGFKT
jgi:hypothetical protein